MRLSPAIRFCVYFTSFLSAAHAFNVTVGTPTQCDDLAVSWTGGRAPFEILLVPVYETLRNISVPGSAFSNGKGSYSIPQLPLKSGTQFLLTMSDATGFGSGGTTTVLTVGDPVANNNCNTTVVSPPFTFELPSSLQQCNGYNFSDYSGGIQPITITALIPGGEFVILNPPNGSSSYNWVADVEAGTDLLFFMIDSQGNQGGISDIEQVSLSSDTSCLNVNSPSSTASAPSVTSSQSTPSATTSNTTSVGIIAGATVGGVVNLGLVIAFGICYRRKASRSSDIMSTPSPTRHKNGNSPQIQPFPYQSDHVNHLALPVPPKSQLHPATTLASDPFTQHLRQISYSNNFAGGRYPDTLARMSDQTAAFPHQTLPVDTPSAHPGRYPTLVNASPGSFTINPHAQFSSIQPSPIGSNIDELSGYGDFTSSHPSPASRQIATIAGQTPPPNYPSAYQAYSTSHPHPSVQLPPLHTSAGSLATSGLPTQLSPVSFTTDAIPRSGDATSTPFPCGIIAPSAIRSPTGPPAQIIVHTDIEDVQATSDGLGVVELPPQYADRQLLPTQPAPVQRR